jgi:hypothetical protein
MDAEFLPRGGVALRDGVVLMEHQMQLVLNVAFASNKAGF